MENQESSPYYISDNDFDEIRDKIVEILSDKRVGGYAPMICASALNVRGNLRGTIYQVQALPLADYKKIYGS